jgi:hypothetical protein
MKTAVSIPDKLFKEAEAEAKRLGVSRSKLHQMALEEFLSKDADAEFTRRMNEAIAKDGGLDTEDEVWIEHSRRTVEKQLKGDKW